MISYYKYLKHGQPMPKGWTLASKLENTRHGHHAVLITRKGKTMCKVITKETKEKAIKLYKQGTAKELVAERFGVAIGTLDKWIKNGI